MSGLARLRSVLSSRVLSSRVPFPSVSRRSLSTDQAAGSDPAVDPFLEQSEGLVYASLTGVHRNTRKTDVIDYFHECHLATDDVKFNYDERYFPVGAVLQFSSHASYNTAVKQNTRQGRLYRLDKTDRTTWDLKVSYNGKALLLEGIPRNTAQEEVERFLCGSNYDPSSLQNIIRPRMPPTVKVMIVKFPNQLDAVNAFRAKNKNFCGNRAVNLRILQ